MIHYNLSLKRLSTGGHFAYAYVSVDMTFFSIVWGLCALAERVIFVTRKRYVDTPKGDTRIPR